MSHTGSGRALDPELGHFGGNARECVGARCSSACWERGISRWQEKFAFGRVHFTMNFTFLAFLTAAVRGFWGFFKKSDIQSTVRSIKMGGGGSSGIDDMLNL